MTNQRIEIVVLSTLTCVLVAGVALLGQAIWGVAGALLLPCTFALLLLIMVVVARRTVSRDSAGAAVRADRRLEDIGKMFARHSGGWAPYGHDRSKDEQDVVSQADSAPPSGRMP